MLASIGVSSQIECYRDTKDLHWSIRPIALKGAEVAPRCVVCIDNDLW